MTREEQLVSCRQCTNRKLNMQVGFVCSLDGEMASFTGECEKFDKDESVELDDKEGLDSETIQNSIPSHMYEKLTFEQDFKNALLVGFLTAIIGAVSWAALTVSTEYQIGYMAIAIGIGVGYAIRITGKGIEKQFGIAGAALAVFSCLLGNFLTTLGFTAEFEQVTYLEVLQSFDYAYTMEVITQNFDFRDLLFYGFAGAAGYKYAFRKLTEQDLDTLK